MNFENLYITKAKRFTFLNLRKVSHKMKRGIKKLGTKVEEKKLS